MDKQAGLDPGAQMVLPGCPLSQGFAARHGWSQSFLCVMWIMGEVWSQAASGLHHPNLATPEGKG